jgi:hypothetical protein
MDARVIFQKKFIQEKIFQEKPVRCASDRGC